ncbi:MAG: DNA-directed RNA polymerase subunit alpha [Thermodesulfovibrionales bacterium]
MDLKKKGFQLPEKMRFEEDTLTDFYGKLIAEPLERGFGTTIGNSLRRVLLSSVEGAAVTGVKINGALHEFTSIEGVKEDVVDIILNIKKLRFSMDGGASKTAVLKAKGPKELTAADLQVDASVRVLNPDQVIATLDKGTAFEAELYIKKGKGFVPAELNKEEGLPVDVISVDSTFSPVKRVNFAVEKARVGRAADYDRLVLEVWTDGSVTPPAAVSQAAAVLEEHFKFFIFESDEEYEEPELSGASPDDEPVFNENLLKSVDELELSVRAQNCLKNADIKNIADLVQKTEHEMLRTKNFGRKSLNEIKEILHSMGLYLGMKVDQEALKNMQAKRGSNAA